MTNIQQGSALRVLYYGAGWPTNIGNAFIDLGAMEILRLALPGAHVSFASEMPRWFFGPSGMVTRGIGDNVARLVSKDRVSNHKYTENAFDIAAVSKCDLVVYSGMAMCNEFIATNGPTICALADRGTPVLLLGTGAQDYTDRERNEYGAFLRKVNPIGFVSRDDRSYDMFASYVSYAARGIDCGFFVADAYAPLELDLPPYVVATFDTQPEPDLHVQDNQLIRAHHSCWGRTPESYARTRTTLVSDIPQDYLTLYAHAKAVHSDRVHACVAALAYGGSARLYHSTPRGNLFETIGAGEIRRNLVRLEPEILRSKKATQVEIVRTLVAEHIPRVGSTL